MPLRFLCSVGRAVTFHDTPLRISNEVDDGVAFFGFGHLSFQFFQRFAVVHPLHENVAIDLLDLADLFGSKSAAAQSYRIDAGIGEGFACRFDKRGYIFSHERASRDHNMGADLNKLVKRARSADDRPVVDFHMAGELYGVYEYAVVADNAVVSDVDIRHEEAVLADHGFVFVACAAADGDV